MYLSVYYIMKADTINIKQRLLQFYGQYLQKIMQILLLKFNKYGIIVIERR